MEAQHTGPTERQGARVPNQRCDGPVQLLRPAAFRVEKAVKTPARNVGQGTGDA